MLKYVEPINDDDDDDILQIEKCYLNVCSKIFILHFHPYIPYGGGLEIYAN